MILASDDVVGKNVLVTGASRGIGKGLALQYAKLGANVFITARNEDKLKEVDSLFGLMSKNFIQLLVKSQALGVFT